MTDVYSELSGVPVEIAIEDDDGPVVPATLHVRSHCETTCQDLGDWVELTPVQENDDFGNLLRVTASYLVPGSVNAIRNRNNRRELKSLLVVANKDLDNEFAKEPPYQYYVVRRAGRT
jgi:hypothetical protein